MSVIMWVCYGAEGAGNLAFEKRNVDANMYIKYARIDNEDGKSGSPLS